MRPFMLHRAVERARNYLLLLRARELVEIHGVAGDAHGEVRIFFGAVHRFAQALPVEHVDVQVVRALCKIAVEQIVEKAERVRPYIKKGGFTLSGGEPLMQPEFAAGLFSALRGRGFHTALDTSGCFGAGEAVREVLRHTGLVICDVKFARAGLFKKYCGGELSRTLDFIALTEEMRVPLWIRQVVVPSINDAPSDARELGRIAASYSNVEKLELLPFRKLCMHKYEALGIDFPLRGVPECGAEKLRELQEAAERERAGV